MIKSLVTKLNRMLEDDKQVEYKKDDVYKYGVITYLVDAESYEYGKVYIIADGFNSYSFCMFNSDGERNVCWNCLREAEVVELFYRAVNKDLELYCY